jgi:hypothetical protein
MVTGVTVVTDSRAWGAQNGPDKGTQKGSRKGRSPGKAKEVTVCDL